MAKDWHYQAEPEGLGFKLWALIAVLVVSTGIALLSVAGIVIGLL